MNMRLQRHIFAVIFMLLSLIVGIYPANSWCAIEPSQVLVLYNADWTEDLPLTETGQDSKEIADYYVRMHTDPNSGEKPYVLGLSCQHGIKIIDEVCHLNQSHLQEESDDNRAGVELIKRRWLVDSAALESELRDSRLVEFALPGGSNVWNVETLQLWLEPENGSNLVVVENGLIEVSGQVSGNYGNDWTIRLNARSFFPGKVKVHASCETVDGKKSIWAAIYTDIDNVTFSRTGSDGQRDDQNYLEDIELPLKAFLENPDNSRPDGTLLKDHILFIVVAYGLPRTATAPYGIARGVTEKLNDFGAIIDLGQRIQLLYYDVEKVVGVQPKPCRLVAKGPFTPFFFRAPQAWPLFGKANPFVHQQLYQKEKKSFVGLQDPPLFSQQNRKKDSDHHLYFVMRIDAPNPLQARGLIDRAVYASKYAGPQMGMTSGLLQPQQKQQLGKSKIGQWLLEKGFHHLYNTGRSKCALEFFHLAPSKTYFNRDPVYLPGGIGGTVISHNGWNRGEMLQDLSRGVTATIGAARVYGGAPHIHNKSWWDDEILYPYLIQGRSLGEVFLMNQVHLGWIATFVGDPLYRLPIIPVNDVSVPTFDETLDVHVWTKEGENNEKEVWLMVNLGSTPNVPETAQLRAKLADITTVVCPTFESQPYGRLGTVTEVCGRTWQLEVIDPYGNRCVKDVLIQCDNSTH
ncbi:MAG: hypothetical protein BA874_03905 [Desulfuromonadales bacterium C00003068]|jgi:hypothetical protein|nr:MAG: hypothetical protein BA874_03905 [Desulfuromonadales bacterium C00003068]